MASRLIKNIAEIPLVTTTGQAVIDQATRLPLKLSMSKVLLQFAGDPAFTQGMDSFPRAARMVCDFVQSVSEQAQQQAIEVDENVYERLLKAVAAPQGKLESSTLGCYWQFLEEILFAKPAPESPAQAAE